MAYLKRNKVFSDANDFADGDGVSRVLDANGMAANQNGTKKFDPSQIKKDPEQERAELVDEKRKIKKALKFLLRFPGELYVRQYTYDISLAEFMTLEVSFDASEYFDLVKKLVENHPIKNSEVENAEKKPEDPVSASNIESLLNNCISCISILKTSFQGNPEIEIINQLYTMISSLIYRLKLRKNEI